MSKMVDMTGRRCERLVVLERTGATPRGQAVWLCKCDCGSLVKVRGADLRNGSSKSCGCLHKDRVSEVNIQHGQSRTRLYFIWKGVKDRCLRVGSKRYADYGGRGITVCDEWQHSFEAFRDWAMANGYRDDLTIDRIDNDKGYSPENCRWATAIEQANNMRKSHMVTYKGKTQTIAQWSRELGISKNKLYHRLLTYHWPIEKAFETP